MKMRVADYIFDKLFDEGAKHIFFVPGGGSAYLTDALAKSDKVTGISVHHEQAAGMAAVTYAKYNNVLGACCVTTGCGGTNAMTPLLDSWQDSVPCVFVSGQVSRSHTTRNACVPLRQMGRQETDIVALTEHISKYAVMLNDPHDAVYELEKAIYIAQSGRKGPVWIDVPLDIQNYVIDPDAERHFEKPVDEKPVVSDFELKEIADIISNAQRPVVLAGNGIRLSDAVEEMNAFINKYDIPFVYSRLGHDIVPAESDLSIGMVGMAGASRAGNFAIQNSDLVICIGCRLSMDTTGYDYEKFARAAKILVVDIDKVEHSKNTVEIDYFYLSDAKLFLSKILTCNIPKKTEWSKKCLDWKVKFPTCVDEYKKSEKVNMYYFTEALSKVLPKGATVLSDAGNAFYTVSPIISLDETQRSITSGCQAEMGYAVPAAVGASFASGNQVVAVTGDGSFMMNIQELATISYSKRDIKLFVMNNNGYSCIRHMQNAIFRGRQIGCDASTGIDFCQLEYLAKAFDIGYARIEGSDNLSDKIDDVLKMDGPVLCEVMCVEEQPYIVVSGVITKDRKYATRPLEDQFPWLDRDVFLSEMIIEPIDQ